MSAAASKPPASPLLTLRNAFFSGLLLLAPLAVTWVVFSWLVGRVGGSFRELFFFYVPASLRNQPSLEIVWNVLATIIVVILVTLLGYLSRYVFSHYFGQLTERLINNIPGVNAVYRTVKQIVETFSAQKRNVFEKVVLIEFPRPGSWVVGFLTNRAQGEVQERTSAELWTVFVPTTPNPTSGFLVLIPKENVQELDMTVGEGMKFIISGGTVVPDWPPANRLSEAVKPSAVGIPGD